MNEEQILMGVEREKGILEYFLNHGWISEWKNDDVEFRKNCIQGLLNLYKKQQKEIERKDKVFDDCKYTIIEYVKTAKDIMQKMEAMIEIEKDVINEFDKLLKGE